MKIKIQENDMIASVKKIEKEIEKLENLQKELQNMLNSTSWDMRARKCIEDQVVDARKLNSELTLITKRMSEMVKLTIDSMKQKDSDLAKNNESSFQSHSESFTIEGPFYDKKLSVGDVGWKWKKGWFESAIDIGLLNAYTDNFIGYKMSDGEKKIGALLSVGVSAVCAGFDTELGNDYIGLDIEGSGYLDGAEIEGGAYYDVNKNKGMLGGEVGANFAKGNIGTQLEFFGIELGVGVEGQIGAGASAFIKIEDGKLKAELGAALGAGGSLSFEIGLKD